MVRACLAEIRPLNLMTGEREVIRVTNFNVRRNSALTGLGGQTWFPAMTKAPVLGITLWNGDFLLPIDSGKAELVINRAGVLKKRHTDINRYHWQGARVVIYAEDPEKPWPWPVRFRGSINEIAGKGTTLSLSASVDTEPFEKNLLSREYKGTGGIEGGEDLKNRSKPLLLGWARNVEPVLIDTVNSVFQFSGYGKIEAVSALYERASSFGPSVGDYPTYGLLVAANIPAGRWGSCLNEGLVRLGAPPYGVITGDVRGHANPVGKNLFNKGVITPGVLLRNDGTTATNAIHFVSDFIPVEALKSYYGRGSLPDLVTFRGLRYTTYYAADRATLVPGGLDITTTMITPPAGAAYVRFTGWLDALDLYQFEEGTAQTSYEPFNGVAPRLTGSVIRALAGLAGVDEDLLDTSSLDAMDVARPFPINMVLDQQTTFLDLARQMVMCLNYQAGIGLLGAFFAAKPDLSRPASLTLHAQGKAKPLVKSTPEELTTSLPYAKTVLGAARCWRPQTKDEIAFHAELAEKGLYDPGAVYREGNIVQMEDGSRWLYINATPSSGNTPPNATYWGQLSGPVGQASNLIFRKSATMPSTPAPSSGLPSGWVDDIGSVGAGDLPVWCSFGLKASGGTTYAWETPYVVSSDKRLFDALDPNGAVKPGQVDTPAIVDEGVNRTGYISSTSMIVFSPSTKTQMIEMLFAKETAGSILICDFQAGMFGADSVDGTLFIEVISGSTVIRVRDQDYQFDCNQETQVPLRLRGIFTGLGAGNYTVRVSFQRFTGNGCRTDGEYDLDVTERMK